MTPNNTQDSDYCAALVRARDTDRWLAARYATPEGGRVLLALYAFHIELRRIPGSVSEPPLGEIRLQWWREALDEIRDDKPVRAHPVVSELAVAGLASKALGSLIDMMVDAAARPLYSEEFADITDLADWMARIDGAVDGLAVMALGGEKALAETAARSGTAFALAREGRRWAPSLASEIASYAKKTAKEAAPLLRTAPADISPALLHLSLTRTYAKRGEKPFDLAKRLQLFSAMAFGRY